MECEKRDRPLGKNTGMLSEHAGMQRGRPRPTWNLIWQGISETTRRASSSASIANGRLGTM